VPNCAPPSGRRVTATLVAAALILAGAAPAAASTLAIQQGNEWRTFWNSERAPSRWSAADPTLVRALKWHRLAKGLEWATVRLACPAPVWRARLIVARVDPREVRLSLAMDLTDMRPAWSIDRAPRDAILAVNAGQFVSAPWGWVTMDGAQRFRPGYGPLSSAISVDAAGNVRWAHGDSLLDPTGVVAGFQSYPTLLAGDGAVPLALRSATGGVSLTHRDARLAIGETRDGKLLIAMTRFDVMGDMGGGVPLGPTTPEMAAILGALGASDAMMLDGGISAQLLLRDPSKKAPLRWPGIRKVPLALIVRPR